MNETNMRELQNRTFRMIATDRENPDMVEIQPLAPRIQLLRQDIENENTAIQTNRGAVVTNLKAVEKSKKINEMNKVNLKKDNVIKRDLLKEIAKFL